MSDSKDPREPSMEEILASIRRIIAEDGEQAGGAAAAPVKEPPVEDVLELTEVVEDDGEAAAHAAHEPATMVAAQPSVSSASGEAGHREKQDAAEPLVSESAAAASLAALSQLDQIGQQKRQRMSDIPLGDGQRTIEDMVRDVLRPLLKEWLEANLPEIVERVVQDEVRRIVLTARGR